MEYKLNKIDTNILHNINEQTKEGKIHSKQSVEVNSDRLKDKKNKDNSKQKEKKKESFNISKYVKGNRTIEVKVYKGEFIEVNVEKEKNKDSDKGLFIDMRR